MAGIESQNQNIQILRGLAVLFVLLHHLSITPLILSMAPMDISMPFWIGVELFFIISGYVIGITSIYRKEVPSSRIFLLRRFFRIYPNLFIFFLISAILNLFLLSLPTDNWGRDNLATSWNQFMNEMFQISTGTLDVSVPRSYQNTVLWSLVIELQFYFVILLTIFFLYRIDRSLIRNFVNLTSIALFIILTSCRILSFFNRTEILQPIQYLLNNKFDFLLVGLILAGFKKPPIKLIKFSPYLLLTIVIMSITFSEPIYPANNGRILNSITLVFVVFLLSYLILMSIFSSPFRIDKLASRVLFKLGDLSYSVFLFQFPVFVFYWLVIDRFFPSVFFLYSGWGYSVLQVLVCIPLISVLSFFSYHLVESKMIAFGKSITLRS